MADVDTRTNTAIGLAEFHEDVAERAADPDAKRFHADTAATLRALAAERNQWIANSRENKLIAEATLRGRDNAEAEARRLRQLTEEMDAVIMDLLQIHRTKWSPTTSSGGGGAYAAQGDAK